MERALIDIMCRGIKAPWLTTCLLIESIGINSRGLEIAAAAGFVYGTGANEYMDRHICQVEVAFIRSEYRRTSLFIRGLQALVDEMKAGNPDVVQVQFWTSTDQGESEKLFSKFCVLPGSTKSLVNGLTFYTVPFHELEALCHRFGRRMKL